MSTWCRTCERVTSYIYDCVMSHVWMRHVTHMNASRHTYEQVRDFWKSPTSADQLMLSAAFTGRISQKSALYPLCTANWVASGLLRFFTSAQQLMLSSAFTGTNSPDSTHHSIYHTRWLQSWLSRNFTWCYFQWSCVQSRQIPHDNRNSQNSTFH